MLPTTITSEMTKMKENLRILQVRLLQYGRNILRGVLNSFFASRKFNLHAVTASSFMCLQETLETRKFVVDGSLKHLTKLCTHRYYLQSPHKFYIQAYMYMSYRSHT